MKLRKKITAWTLEKIYSLLEKRFRFYENKPLNFSEFVINQSVPFGNFVSLSSLIKPTLV